MTRHVIKAIVSVPHKVCVFIIIKHCHITKRTAITKTHVSNESVTQYPVVDKFEYVRRLHVRAAFSKQ